MGGQYIQTHRSASEKVTAAKGGKQTGSSSRIVFPDGAKQQPATVLQFVGFQGARQWIDQPGMGDAVTGVKRQFQGPILLRRGRREDFANPVGHDFKAVVAGNGRHPFAPPAGQIGYGDFGVADEVNFGFGQNPPAAWAFLPSVERQAENAADSSRRRDLWPGRSVLLDVELAADDLAHLVFRQGK